MKEIERIKKRSFVFFIFGLLCTALVLSGCKTTGRTPSTTSQLPRAHVWSYLKDEDRVPYGYGMYTYVLINRKNSDAKSWKRYRALIKEITGSTDQEISSNSNFNKSLFNIFLIPSTDIGLNPSDSSLNQKISNYILTSIVTSVEDRSLREMASINPGPFLISLKSPINYKKGVDDHDILYVDLTKTNEAAMREVVAEYKKRLISESIHGIENYKSIRLSLLNILLDADDSIKILKIAYADIIESDKQKQDDTE